MPKSKKNQETTQTATENAAPIAPSISAPVNTGRNDDRGSNSGDGTVSASDNGLSELTTKLLDKAKKLSETLNNKAIARTEAAEEWLIKLVDGDASVEDLITRYGLTDDVTAQRQLTELNQLRNSIQISIAKKNVQIEAIRDSRKEYEIAEQESRTAAQVSETANAADQARHSSVMLELKSKIRAQTERKTDSDLYVKTHQADKSAAKRNQILTATLAKKATGNNESARKGVTA
jgi:hypothetical protein